MAEEEKKTEYVLLVTWEMCGGDIVTLMPDGSYNTSHDDFIKQVIRQEFKDSHSESEIRELIEDATNFDADSHIGYEIKSVLRLPKDSYEWLY